jgi:hypothetical protein
MRLRLLLMGLVATFVSDPGNADDAPTFKLSPVPQVSLSVPTGWEICDEAKGSVSGNGVTDAVLQAMPCKAIPSAVHFVLRSTDTNRPALVFLAVDEDPGITPQSLAVLTPGSIAEGIDSTTCQKVAQVLQFTPNKCDVAVGRLPGGPAILGFATGWLNRDNAPVKVRTVQVGFTGGMMTLFAMGPDPEAGDVDAIVNSIAVQ